jgi:cation diffusion facilitator CzcD-associated flavoprotein CzcO
MADLQVPRDTQEKYRIEKAKRLASDNFDKRIALWKDHALAEGATDPWARYDELARQEPYLKEGSRIRFLIVGAGHSGLVHAYHLIAAGFSARDIVVVDAAGGWGGTWYWNRYPGLQCDVEGYCYLPLLEQSGFIPRHRYSTGEEIRQNAEHIAAKFELQGMFCTSLVGADWNEQQGRWDIRLRRDLGPAHPEMNREFTISTQFFVSALGPINNPSIPALPGLGEYAKEHKVFHTARWDYSYTGGSQGDPSLVHLKDKVIGIIGTAASAVQAVPELAKWVKHLYVFQRTPTYIGPHEDSETTPESWDRVTQGGKPGWQAERMENQNLFFTDDPEATPERNLVQDERSRFPPLSGFWGSRRGKGLKADDAEAHTKSMLEREHPHVARLREHMSRVVKDPATAEKLTPWYPGWCKRPTYNNAYLQALNRPNVTLVDTDGQGVQSFNSRGAVVGKGESTVNYELDAIVLATGFQVAGTAGRSPAATSRTYFRGRHGRDFTDKWQSPDFATLFGVATNGFPNLFISSAANSAASANLTSVYNSQAKITAHFIKTAFAGSVNPDKLVIEVDKAAEEEWTAKVVERATWFSAFGACPPTYFTDYKHSLDDPNELKAALKKATWGLGPVDYDHVLSQYIKDGSLKGVTVAS